jgi:hypothetical protein
MHLWRHSFLLSFTVAPTFAFRVGIGSVGSQPEIFLAGEQARAEEFFQPYNPFSGAPSCSYNAAFLAFRFDSLQNDLYLASTYAHLPTLCSDSNNAFIQQDNIRDCVWTRGIRHHNRSWTHSGILRRQ